MNVSVIETTDDKGRKCFAWGYGQGADARGGYCATVKDCISNAFIVAGLKPASNGWLLPEGEISIEGLDGTILRVHGITKAEEPLWR